MKLYIISYSYLDHKGKLIRDTWEIVKKDIGTVHEFMEHNKKEFEKYGMNIVEYSFRAINSVIDGYRITIEKESEQ